MATPKGATQTVSAGATAVTVTSTFTTPYRASVSAGWATDRFIAPASKTATQFVAQFTVPAPAGGSSLDWTVVEPNVTAS